MDRLRQWGPTLKIFCLFVVLLFAGGSARGADSLDSYNVVWRSQSKNSAESMPVGGGDIGVNVWVENNELLFYIGRSGTFDENNQTLKLGRVRVKLDPNPFTENSWFRQELKLRKGCVEIQGNSPGRVSATIEVWVEVFRPVIHVDIGADKPVTMQAQYESWRTADRELANDRKKSRFGCFGLEGYPGTVVLRKDTIGFRDNTVEWYHRNGSETIFDIEVRQQKLEKVKEQLWNPLKNLTFGGLMTGRGVVADGTSEGRYVRTNFRAWKLKSREPARTHKLKVFLHTDQAKTVEAWRAGLDKLAGTASSSDNRAREKNLAWWQQFWQRSHLRINCDRPDRQDKAWQVGRNYHLFRYMLGCNAYSEYPTKFNGGTLTYDPQFVGGRYAWIADADETPDYRGWGGGSFTAQNQRLVYFPMLKTGDFDLMITQFEFYRRALSNAEARVRVYWGHDGCCFTEQMNQYGLPIGSHYGWVDATGYRSRPADLEDGVQVNGAIGYLYESQLEFSWMVLKYYEYTGKDISAYMPFIESSVTFYDRHYQYRCKQLTGKPLDENGHLVIYPSAAMEGYKGCRNPASVIAGLHAVLSSMLELPERYAPAAKKQAWRAMLERVPPLPVKTKDGHRTIQPAQSHAHRGGHLPELYPLYPYERYGLGKPDLEVAVNTWRYGLTEQARTAYISWHQGNIFAARLGLTDEAAALSIKKLEDSGRRFPAFWGPGHDYVPDHNWGSSGMIGLQEMLMQAFARKIYLLPAWPKGWDVDFKLHAPYKTVVEGVLRNGKIESLKVTPEDRREDIEVMEPR